MIVYNGFHRIEKQTVNIKGTERVIEKVIIKSAVAGVVLDAENKLALVKQYRPCVDETLYELPAGLLDKNLSPQETLIEELEEECGINRDSILSIAEPIDYYIVCGSSDAKMYLMTVRLSSVETSKEVNDADVEAVEWLPLDEFKNLVKTGKIKDSKTLHGFYLLQSEV